MTTKQETCEERIGAQLAGRIASIGALQTLSQAYDCETLAEAVNANPVPIGEALREIDGEKDDDAYTDREVEDLMEKARERLSELPLGVSAETVFRIDLSTGGPGDWLEVKCSGDTPSYEPAGDGERYEILSISYHFNDWFDHAERNLTDDDLEVAEAFAHAVVPELVE